MDCKYVRESQCICYKFHPKGSSIFLLVLIKNRLKIVQENLYTGLVMNEFIVPLKQQNLNVQNYILNYEDQLQLIVLTLYNHVLIYSLQKKILIFVGQLHGKNPYYIEKAYTLAGNLYFTAVEQHNIYSINLEQALKTNTVPSYFKYKTPQQTLVRDFLPTKDILVAMTTDKYLRLWERQSGKQLKYTNLSKYGELVCLSFSKNEEILLIGTSQGYVLGFDGPQLASNFIQILQKRVIKGQIRSLSWFHYSGQTQSKRYLIMTQEGSIKLFSFFLQKQKQNLIIGKTVQLALLYQKKTITTRQFTIRSHHFSNFIFFSPGVLLYMVDNYPKIYYPVIAKQMNLSFQQLVPNPKKQIFFQRDYLFIEGLQIKRLTSQIQPRVELSSVLPYENLKILKLDFRPIMTSIYPQSKILITYYLHNMVRSLVLSKINLSVMTQNVQNFKQYSGNICMFIGPQNLPYPLMLILQEDKQTISILQQDQIPNQILDQCDPQERKHLSLGPRQILSTKLKIRIQRIYETPFRSNYVVLYQSQNLLRFSRNIDCQNEILDYQVYSQLSFRLEYYDIIIDVIWTKGAQFAAVVCVDKVVFLSPELKQIRIVDIEYIVQAQWVGFTLIVTTKVDVQYVDISSKPVQLYCIQNFQSKYLVLAIMVDRILSIQRFQNNLTCKSRYFNLMEPLISGYLSFHKLYDTPIDQIKCKKIIECYSPYHIVSQTFLNLLNERKLSNFSKYFIENNMKLYSRSIRANTFNSSLKMERFIDENVWNRNKKNILQLFLTYQESSSSSDPFQQQKFTQACQKLSKIISQFSFKSITQAIKEQSKKGGIMIANNFGEKALTQIYFDIKQGQKVPMEIQPFKAQNIGQWIGLFGSFIQAKVGSLQSGGVVISQGLQIQDNNNNHDEDQDKPFKDLIVYYRFDQGKGETVQDLSDFGNNSDVSGEWIALEDDPMQNEDKWGKKCPPQFAIQGFVMKQKKINCVKMNDLTVQIWMKFSQVSFQIFNIGNSLKLAFKNQNFEINDKKVSFNRQARPFLQNWNHLCLFYEHKTQRFSLLINSQQAFSQFQLPITLKKDGLTISEPDKQTNFTQFRLWKKILDVEEIKDSMRTPLQLVHQKRKKLKMKIKQKKKKDSDMQFPSFPF